jgi:hypothetical protein
LLFPLPKSAPALRSSYPQSTEKRAKLAGSALNALIAAKLELFRKANDLLHNRHKEGSMKHDAFADVHCPFNYLAELGKAREALNAKVGTYISENPAAGYRELSKQFGISLAALCAIAKKYSRKRKPGRRSRGRKITFDVQHEIGGKKVTTRVTIVSENARDASVGSIRSLIATYYKTSDISRGSVKTAERYVEFTVRELEQLVISASVNEKMAQRMP